MVESFDDVHVVGLTTTTTNVWAQEALSYGIRIGEFCGGNDVTYIAGCGHPLREGRLDSINREIDANPGEDASWRGDDVSRQSVKVPVGVDQTRFWDIIMSGISKF